MKILAYIKTISFAFILVFLNSCGNGMVGLLDGQALSKTDSVLISIYINPGGSSIEKIDTIQYTAMGNYEDGSTLDISDQVTWSSSNTGVATISNSSGPEGLALGVGAGTTSIEVAMDTISGSTSLTITDAPTWDLEITTTGVNQNMSIGFEGPVNMIISWETVQARLPQVQV